MKYLLKEDVDGVTHGRVIANADGVFCKGYKFDFLLYRLVDLGLPSGTLWADRNIGAASPEDAGLYFQWGDTQGWRRDQVGTGEGKKEFD